MKTAQETALYRMYNTLEEILKEVQRAIKTEDIITNSFYGYGKIQELASNELDRSEDVVQDL